MDCSVVICTHNRSKSLARTLDALLKVKVHNNCRWEVIVVDNASEDDTKKIVTDYINGSAIPIHYVKENRLGHSFALNAGIDNSKGNVIAFTDDDAIPSTNWIDSILSIMDLSKADIVFGRVTPIWETSPPKWFSDRFRGRFALLDYGPDPFVVEDARKPFYGVNHAVRREAMLRLGGYREDRGARGAEGGSGNDTDLFERALAAGLRIAYNPKIVVEHVIPDIRCKRSFYRKLTNKSKKSYFLYIKSKEKDLPKLLGIPRYRFRIAAHNALILLKSLVISDKANAFYYELELRKFALLLVESMRTKLGSTRSGKTDPKPVSTD